MSTACLALVQHSVFLFKCISVEIDVKNENKVLVPYMDSAFNMDTPHTFKSNKFYRHMTLHVHEEQQLKR